MEQLACRRRVRECSLGQSNFTSNAALSAAASTLLGPSSVAIANGKLFVADTGNSRVLIWNSIPTTNFQPADVVLGQADFVSDDQNRGAFSPNANTLDNPRGIYSDGVRLVVAYSSINRSYMSPTHSTIALWSGTLFLQPMGMRRISS